MLPPDTSDLVLVGNPELLSDVAFCFSAFMVPPLLVLPFLTARARGRMR